MLFTTRVLYQHAPDLEQEANLLFVRYYIAAPDQQLSKEQREQDLTGGVFKLYLELQSALSVDCLVTVVHIVWHTPCN